MSTCEHCGSPIVASNDNFAASTPLYETEDSTGSGWLCFRGGCTKKSDQRKRGKDTEFPSEFLREGRYQRRTIQFEIDPANSVSSRRLQSTVSSSILKASKRGPNDSKYGQISPVPRHHLKLLLVFAHPDPVCDTLTKAAEKLGFEVTTSNTDIEALDEYQAKSHDLVIVDARVKCFDNDLLCRAKVRERLMRNICGSFCVCLGKTMAEILSIFAGFKNQFNMTS